MATLKTNIQLLSRYRQILFITIKYGFGHVLEEIGLSRRFKHLVGVKTKVDATHHNQWERIRMAIEELGTTYIKFAQILANRPDMIPKDLTVELVKLQDHVPAFDGKVAKEIIERELGKDIDEVFSSFDIEPFACASIGQVHKAVLKDGTDVVVKVLRPGAKEKVMLDLRIMHYIARTVEKNSPTFALFDPVGNVKMFEDAIKKELSFSHEALNLQRFANDFKNNDAVVVPRFYPQYSTNKIMVMEFIRGVRPTDIEGVKTLGSDPKEVARQGINAFFRQVFDYGFFHADPHPGNIFVLTRNRICFIDFGMMGRVLNRDLEFFADILFGAATKNSSRVIWGVKNLAVSHELDDSRAFEYKIDELVNTFSQLPAEKINFSEFFDEMKDLVIEYRIRMSGDFFLLSKALVTIESVGRALYPEINIIDEVKPHLFRVLRVQYGPKAMIKKLMAAAKDSVALLETMPQDLREIIKKAKRGEFTVAIEHKGIEDFSTNLDRMVNRLVMAIICAALALGSSVLMAIPLPPLYYEYSLPGIFGFVIAAIVGLRLLYSVLRNYFFK
jgi:ubiquinone biosynthesis protein